MNLNLNLKVNLNPNLNLKWGSSQYSTSEKYFCYNQVASVVRLNQEFKKVKKG